MTVLQPVWRFILALPTPKPYVLWITLQGCNLLKYDKQVFREDIEYYLLIYYILTIQPDFPQISIT